MALVNGTTQLGFKFITTATWNSRVSGETPAALTAEELASGDIIFIEATNQIFAGGAYFGVTPSQAQQLSTLWSDIETANTGLKAKVSNLEEKVGTEAKLSQTLLAIANDLKSKLDGGSYTENGPAGAPLSVTKTEGGQQVTISNVTEAVNELFDRVSSMVSGVSQVNGKTGQVTLYGADIAVSGTNSTKIDVELGKKVAISTDATVKTNTGKKASDYTDTEVIGDAIEAAHAAAAAANNAAGNKIAKSSGTASTLAGDSDATLTPANLTDADAIVTALVTAYNTLVGTGTHNWGSTEKKTLGTLRDLIATLRADLTALSKTVGTITDDQIESIIETVTALKKELIDPTDAQGLVKTFLDTANTILGGAVASGDNKGTYATTSGTDGATEYATNLGDIITNLEKEIAAAKAAGENAGVTSLNSKTGDVTIASGTGTSVDNSGTNIVINATAAATTTTALTQSQNGYGATTASGSTIQTALQDINNAASSAGKAANDALNQLKWTVV